MASKNQRAKRQASRQKNRSAVIDKTLFDAVSDVNLETAAAEFFKKTTSSTSFVFNAEMNDCWCEDLEPYDFCGLSSCTGYSGEITADKVVGAAILRFFGISYSTHYETVKLVSDHYKTERIDVSRFTKDFHSKAESLAQESNFPDVYNYSVVSEDSYGSSFLVGFNCHSVEEELAKVVNIFAELKEFVITYSE